MRDSVLELMISIAAHPWARAEDRDRASEIAFALGGPEARLAIYVRRMG